MTEVNGNVQALNHDIKVNDVLQSDDQNFPFIVYQGKKGSPFARAYNDGNKWKLVTSKDFRSQAVVIFLDNKDFKESKIGDKVTVRSVQPKVVFGIVS